MQILKSLLLAAAVVNAVPTPKPGLTVGKLIARADDRVEIARAEKAEEEAPANKVDLQAQFDTPTELQGGNVQQDTTFPPGVSSWISSDMLASST